MESTNINVPVVPTVQNCTSTTAHKESLLSKLYPSIVHIEKCDPEIQMDDLKITAKELQINMAKHMPYEQSRQKVTPVTDDPAICLNSIINVIKCMLKLQRVIGDESTRIVEVTRVVKFKNVKFVHSSVDKSETLKPAHFILQVPACDPNSVQCISTGYVLNAPKDVHQHTIVNKVLVTAGEESEQSLNFVVIPQILSKFKHVLPQLTPRDPFDTGLFTVNLLNTTGEAAQVTVFLYAFLVRTDINGNNCSIRRQTNGKMIKPKDATVGNGRFIKNLEVGVFYEKGVIKNKSSIHFNLFDIKQDQNKVIPNDEIIIHNIPTLFSSRKREWVNDNLFTISGMFLPMGTSCLPIVTKGSKYMENCFCITHIEARLELHTIGGAVQPHFTMINGAMYDLPSYKVLRKTRKRMIRSMIMLKSAALACHMFDKEKYDFSELMRLADFGQVLSKEKIKEIDMLYAQRHNAELLQSLSTANYTYSQQVYNYFNQLAIVFCKPLIYCDVNLKRSLEDALDVDTKDDIDEIVCKKLKE